VNDWPGYQVLVEAAPVYDIHINNTRIFGLGDFFK
jgi:hypothetical protein